MRTCLSFSFVLFSLFSFAQMSPDIYNLAESSQIDTTKIQGGYIVTETDSINTFYQSVATAYHTNGKSVSQTGVIVRYNMNGDVICTVWIDERKATNTYHAENVEQAQFYFNSCAEKAQF